MTTTESHILREFVRDLAEMLDIPVASATTGSVHVAVKRLVDEHHAARGTTSADTKRRLAELETLAGWAAFGTETANEVWESQEKDEFPDTIQGRDLVRLVERELLAHGVPESLLGPLTDARLQAFREAYAAEWRELADVDELDAPAADVT
jgi:hypothetical protein